MVDVELVTGLVEDVAEVELEDSKPQHIESSSTEPFIFNSFDHSSPCDYSSPFDPSQSAEDMFFQLSASTATNPTPPDSPSGTGEPLIMDPLAMVSHADDVFFGANDLKDSTATFNNDMQDSSAFWM